MDNCSYSFMLVVINPTERMQFASGDDGRLRSVMCGFRYLRNTGAGFSKGDETSPLYVTGAVKGTSIPFHRVGAS